MNDFDSPDLFTAFEQANNVTVQKNVYPSDKFRENFLVALNAKQQIDIGAINGQDARVFAAKGQLVDLTGKISYMNRFYESSTNQFVIGGKTYALPATTIWNMVLYYNKDIFKKYGLNAPQTYQDLITIRDMIKNDGIAPIAVGAANPWDLTNWYFVNFFQASGNKGLERTEATLRGQAKFTDPDYIEAMGYIEKFAKDDMFQKGFLGADAQVRLATFASGKTAMYFGGNWDLPTLLKSGMTTDNVGICNWPLMKIGAKAQVSGTAAGAAACIFTTSAPGNMDLDMKYLDYFTSDDMNIKCNKIMNVFLSTNKNVTIPGIDPVNAVIQKDLVPNIVTFLDWYWPSEVTEAFATGLQSVMALQETPDQAMANVQKAYDTLVKNGYNYDTVQ